MKKLKLLMVAINSATSIFFTAFGLLIGSSLAVLGIITLLLSIISLISLNPLNKLLYCGSSVMLASASAAIAYASSAGVLIYSAQSYEFTEFAGIAGVLVFIILVLIACSGAW